MNAIKSIRTRLGLTQAALAEAIGCTQGNVGHYEIKGQTVPPDVARRLITYAATLGVTLTFDDVYGPVIAQPSDQQTSSQEETNV
jgi:putative transcriptional regulator